MINLENENYADTCGPTSPAKYLNGTLVPQGQLLTKYYGIGHVSLDNYIAQISGQAPNPNTQADCLNYTEFDLDRHRPVPAGARAGLRVSQQVKTIGDQLTAAGKTWKGYMEDIANSATEPKTCRHPPIGATDPDDHPDQDRHVRDRATTRGCTSTRSSTRPIATRTSSASMRSRPT